MSLVGGESLVYWLKKLIFRSAWLDHRVKEGMLDVAWDEEWPTSATAIRTATERCWSWRRCRPGTSRQVSGGDRAGPIAGYLAALLAVDTQVELPVSCCSAR